MSNFSASAELDVVVSQSSLRSARSEIESELGDVGVNASASNQLSSSGGSRVAGKERAMSRSLLSDQNSHLSTVNDTLDINIDLNEERNDILREILDAQEMTARQDGGSRGLLPSLGGLAAGGLAIAGLLGSALMNIDWVGLFSDAITGVALTASDVVTGVALGAADVVTGVALGVGDVIASAANIDPSDVVDGVIDVGAFIGSGLPVGIAALVGDALPVGVSDLVTDALPIGVGTILAASPLLHVADILSDAFPIKISDIIEGEDPSGQGEPSPEPDPAPPGFNPGNMPRPDPNGTPAPVPTPDPEPTPSPRPYGLPEGNTGTVNVPDSVMDGNDQPLNPSGTRLPATGPTAGEQLVSGAQTVAPLAGIAAAGGLLASGAGAGPGLSLGAKSLAGLGIGGLVLSGSAAADGSGNQTQEQSSSRGTPDRTEANITANLENQIDVALDISNARELEDFLRNPERYINDKIDVGRLR